MHTIKSFFEHHFCRRIIFFGGSHSLERSKGGGGKKGVTTKAFLYILPRRVRVECLRVLMELFECM